jgi:hypothetical protein
VVATVKRHIVSTALAALTILFVLAVGVIRSLWCGEREAVARSFFGTARPP